MQTEGPVRDHEEKGLDSVKEERVITVQTLDTDEHTYEGGADDWSVAFSEVVGAGLALRIELRAHREVYTVYAPGQWVKIDSFVKDKE